MTDHLIVIFDRSGSMNSSFRAGAEVVRSADFVGQHIIKIQEAQEQLIARLRKSRFEVVTIIPFHSEVEPPLTASLRNEQSRIEQYIRRLQAGGDTNLYAALSLAIEKGVRESYGSFVRYLIVTDGLSSTRHQDASLLATIPNTQGIDGILIDPTPQGETHLQSLCIRGSYVSVGSPRQLAHALEEHEAQSSERIDAMQHYRVLRRSNAELSNRLEQIEQKLLGLPVVNIKHRQALSRATKELQEIEQHEKSLVEKVANLRIPIDKLNIEYEQLQQKQSEIGTVIQLFEEFFQNPPYLKISLSHPKLLSKRFPSPFIIHIYPPEKRSEIETRLDTELQEWDLKEQVYDSELTPGLTVVIKLHSPEIEFSSVDVIKTIRYDVNSTSFIAKPKDTCYPGNHVVILSVSDKETGNEYVSMRFSVEIVDFAFDHISRPFISQAVSVVLGVGSLTTFILTLLGQIDIAFGLASGTAGGVLATVLYTRFLSLYSRPTTVVNQP